ncbi:MAG TPA: symmetrical bis(5'-nucleosyl)-tetraphosphatase [Thermoanaerobaculia bacterium]|jgi:bis(5'-nucleosyl)-tetraphosphatase (symmetrical)|nr:symmetrical bis(5'-nucleosyl)-tetraphosphatase [Thermoanaerobaculia bacterium]
MATYAIGDVHGCFETLKRLLRRVAFDPREDRLWLVGDLVNRGPRSLEVLRWAAEQDGRIVAVLGNHDLHLLARAAGVSGPKKRDTLDEILEAQDCGDLLAWLRSRPLVHREGETVLVHAGLFPDWTPAEAERLAREVEERLQGEKASKLLAAIDQKTPERWKDGLSGHERARAALAGFARLRTLEEDGRMCADFSGPPGLAPRGCRPWYAFPGRKSAGATVVFGHWAALGLKMGKGIAALDTGCAWGRELTALRLDDWRLFQEPAGES